MFYLFMDSKYLNESVILASCVLTYQLIDKLLLYLHTNIFFFWGTGLDHCLACILILYVSNHMFVTILYHC